MSEPYTNTARALRRVPAGDPWRLSVAPMMGYTDRHFRRLLRAFSPHAALYTEMVTCNAVRHRGPGLIALDDPGGHTALQLGGSDPYDLAACAALAEAAGYTEVNLNAGCPSPRVSKGRFGACLMAEPELVRDCLQAMREACSIPVTLKCRLGIDEHDHDAFLHRFTDTVVPVIDGLIVHARIALLEGLSPEENREIPPLQYPRAHALALRYPGLPVQVNGGLRTAADVAAHLPHAHGVMLGRAICADPALLARLDAQIHGGDCVADEFVLARFVDYMRSEQAAGVPCAAVAKRALGLFTGRPGARAFRRAVTQLCHRHVDDPQAYLDAAAHIGAAHIETGHIEAA